MDEKLRHLFYSYINITSETLSLACRGQQRKGLFACINGSVNKYPAQSSVQSYLGSCATGTAEPPSTVHSQQSNLFSLIRRAQDTH